MAITVYGIPLSPVTSFKYLGILLLAADDEWPAVVHNLQREWKKWERLSRVLIREGSDSRALGRIYVTMVQTVMMYGL